MAILDWLKEVPLSAVLRERLVDSESKIAVLEQEIVELKAEKAELCLQLEEAKNEIQIAKENKDAFHNLNPNSDVCEHCGSPRLKRTGSRPNDTFSALGVKDAVFTCQDCGKESAFIIRQK